jgi:DNA-directed RNA polymerase specialized sigma24 family protein
MASVIDGEDVLEDTLVRAFVALQDLEETPPLRSWLFRIAHNRALDLLRRRRISSRNGDVGRVGRRPGLLGRVGIEQGAPAFAVELRPLPFGLGEAVSDCIDGSGMVPKPAMAALNLDVFARHRRRGRETATHLSASIR